VAVAWHTSAETVRVTIEEGTQAAQRGVAGFATAATSAIVRFGAGTPRRRGQLGVVPDD
jgi:hypothetical protein